MKESPGKQKKVLVDICHLPQFNLFKDFIIQYYKKWPIDVVLLNRGKLVEIAKHELPSDLSVRVIGDYDKNTNKFTFALKVIFPRIIQLFKLIRSKKYSLIISSTWNSNLIAKTLNIPNIVISDDLRPIIKNIWEFSANEIFLPIFHEESGKYKTFKCLKEWAYLNTETFRPKQEILKKYKVKAKEYIFIREVSVKSLNYTGQKENSILSVASKLPDDLTVLLSLEDKDLKSRYPSNWYILEEPVDDIHSLMYYSKVVISSGDSMAREGGMLGVPSIYVGKRNMPANNVLINRGILHHIFIERLPVELQTLVNKSNTIKSQEAFRNKLKNDWERLDIQLYSIVSKYLKN